ncbi:MAG: 5-(carboxyamino)imidazole ribonucleotide synthase [Burkholderiales bacterium]|jgi:5-(carboxyamino)imidazole ribonucleotide synthase|nr:5-(carboxyamino)imidazole ribonucleotide synthase [Burkholderiales bacterium]
MEELSDSLLVPPVEEGWFDTKPQPVKVLARGAWIALFGGGQLGSMFCDAAHTLGFRVAAVDPDPDAPITTRADAHWSTDYDDETTLKELIEKAETATVEFENVPYTALAQVARHMPLRPSVDDIRTAQDRVEEKAFFARHGLPIVPFFHIRSVDDLRYVPDYLFPGILKTAQFGYDGKGQRIVNTPKKLKEAFRELGGVSCVFEQRIKLKGEISVLIARNAQGETALWSIAENYHRDNILDVTIAPARVPEEIAQAARQYAKTAVNVMCYQGVLCIEFFIDIDNMLYLNEMAPRPHNSGHHTIESSVTSQFEQQVRVVAGLPLGDTTQKQPAVMVNLLGDLWFADDKEPNEPDWGALLLGVEGALLHLYGKKRARRGRKMGHITFCAPMLDDALRAAESVRKKLGLPPITNGFS